MIIKRLKLFTNGKISVGPNIFGIDDGDIIKNGPKPSSNPFGPWNVVMLESVEEDILLNPDNYFSQKDLKKIDKILDWIKDKPYDIGGFYGIHPLWRFQDKKNRFSIWSADINKKDRLVYLVFKSQNSIVVINCKNHYVGDEPYYK